MADPNFDQPKGGWGQDGPDEKKPGQNDPKIDHPVQKVGPDGRIHVSCGGEYIVTAEITQKDVADCTAVDFRSMYDQIEKLLDLEISKIDCDPTAAIDRCDKNVRETYRKWECAAGKATLVVSKIVFCKDTDKRNLDPPVFDSPNKTEGIDPGAPQERIGVSDLGDTFTKCGKTFRLVLTYSQDVSACDKQQIEAAVKRADHDGRDLALQVVRCEGTCQPEVTTPWCEWECIGKRITVKVLVLVFCKPN